MPTGESACAPARSVIRRCDHGNLDEGTLQ